MGLFGKKKQEKQQQSAPAAPANTYTPAQYVAAGHDCRNKQKWGEAVECYKIAANMGDPEALYWLANCVLTGKGAQKDDNLACQLYSLAARKNHPQATDTLFKYLDAVIQDSLKTNDFNSLTPYLKSGAEAGHIPSVYLYGYFWTVGAGNLPQNKDEGYKWIKLAADRGYDLAIEALTKYF